jgi:curved DNA-binding protein CbpA
MSGISNQDSPHRILGVAANAGADEIRAAYLAKVRQFPPDRDPERFREIHAAYELLNDPLNRARVLVAPPKDKPNLRQLVEAAESQLVRIPPRSLLALGNQE